VRPETDTLPLLALTTDKAQGMRTTGAHPFPSLAVDQYQDGTILLIER
jgi:hypothetical protein